MFKVKQILKSVEISSLEARRPATCSRDPAVLLDKRIYSTEIDLNGSREQVAGRRNLKCQQTLFKGLLFLMLINVSQALLAEDTENTPSYQRIPLLTLEVKKYSEMEMKLRDALLNGDMKIVNLLLSPTFEERNKNNPGIPIPKEGWISQQLKNKTLANQSIEQMAVHKLGDVNIVSYLIKSNNSCDNKIFIVDVWQQKDDHDLLIVRYKSSL